MHHPAWLPPVGDSGRDRGRDALRRIASTLGIPVETLARETDQDSFPDETAELVRLWFTIRDAGARRRIVEQVRRAAGA